VRGNRSTACQRGRGLSETTNAFGFMALKSCSSRSLLGWLLLTLSLLPALAAEPATATRFQAIHVYLDAREEPLAAYQLLLRATTGNVKIVGIEGGESDAFKQPPYYDPKAIQQERVILAAFSTRPKSELPTGKVRVATIHLQVTGDAAPEFETKLQAAANHDGRKLAPIISLEPVKP